MNLHHDSHLALSSELSILNKLITISEYGSEGRMFRGSFPYFKERMFRERFLLSKKEKNVESFRQTPRSSKAKQSLILLVIKFD